MTSLSSTVQRRRLRSFQLFLLAIFSFNSAIAQDPPNPRIGYNDYIGTGTASRAPEVGEVWFTWETGLHDSDESARTTLNELTAPYWKAIQAKIPADKIDELNRPFWEEIVVSGPARGDQIKMISERPDRGLVEQKPVRKATRIDLRTGAELPLEGLAAPVYSAMHTFGVRSSDLNWLEGLVRTIKKQKLDAAPLRGVQLSGGEIAYDVSEATKVAMLDEIYAKTKEEAIGRGSKFEIDKEHLLFTSAFFKGKAPAYASRYQPEVGNPVASGEAPLVTLTLPFAFEAYAENGDLIDSSKWKKEGVSSKYDVEGKASTKADFAEVTLTLTADRCEDRAALARISKEPQQNFIALARNFVATHPVSESHRMQEVEGTLERYWPYEPIKWNADNAVTHFRDQLTGKLVASPASGSMQELPPYWTTSRTVTLRSHDFAGLLKWTQAMRKTYGTRELQIPVPTGGILDATRAKLSLAARQDAVKKITSATGLVACDSAQQNFSCVHITKIEEGRIAQAKSRGAERMMMAQGAPEAAFAAGGAPPSDDELVVEVEFRPGEERPLVKMGPKTVAYTIEFQTANFATCKEWIGQTAIASKPPKAKARKRKSKPQDPTA